MTGPRVEWVVGKGGVGRSTVAAALAVSFADEGRRVLLLSIGAMNGVGELLPDAPPGVTVRHVDGAARWSEFRDRHRRALHALLSEGSFLDDHLARTALTIRPPGLDEWMGALELASVADGPWDEIVVDGPATGHFLRLFEVPEQAERWLEAADALRARPRYLRQRFGSGGTDHVDELIVDLRARIARVRALRDESRAWVVALREPAVLAETERLERALAGRVRDVVRLWNRDPVGLPESRAPLRGTVALRAWWRREPAPRELPSGPPRVVRALPIPTEPVVWVVGKGGVGKTTIACALAIGLAEDGHRTLLVNLDPADSVGDVLGVALDDGLVDLGGGLWACAPDPVARLAELKGALEQDLESLFSHAPAGLDLPFDRPVLEHLLELTPTGMDEIVGLWRLGELVGHGVWDRVVVDTAPGRQFLDLAQLPDALTQWRRWAQSLLLANRAVLRLPALEGQLRSLRTALVGVEAATERGSAVLVTRAEPGVAVETERLAAALAKVPLAVRATVINAVDGPAPLDVRGPTGVVTRGHPPVGRSALSALSRDLFLGREACPRVA